MDVPTTLTASAARIARAGFRWGYDHGHRECPGVGDNRARAGQTLGRTVLTESLIAMTINDDILAMLDTLEAIRFLTHSLEGEPATFIAQARAELPTLTRKERAELRALLRKDLKAIRRHYGALASDAKSRKMLTEAARYPGYAYLPKRFIDRELFSRYDQVFPRWPFVPGHALVVFDEKKRRSLRNIYQAEIELYRDALHMLERAREFHKGITDFRKREPKDQRLLQTYLRAAATATFQTLEAYLNALAYDCFMEHHDSLETAHHDLLAEWDSAKKRRAYVAFERKLREYPAVFAKARGLTLDVAGWECLKFIIEVGKSLRDAITHPSPFVNPKTKREEKIFWMVGINLDVVEKLFRAAREYMVAIENGLTGDAKSSAPWLFSDEASGGTATDSK